MNILIIGNLGYIGPVTVEHYKRTRPEAKLFGFDIGYFAGNETVRNNMLPETSLVAQYFGDVRTMDYSVLDDMDSVVYLAAISNDPMGNVYEGPAHKINHESAIAIAEESKKRGVKSFVFASSCSVYGLADKTPRNENSEINPLTTYAKSKVNGEMDLKKLADSSFQITCLRFATACGFSSRLRLDLVLNDFVASAIVSEKIEILSDGTPWRPLINVKDMARAIEWASVRENGDRYLVLNVGSNHWNYSVLDLAKAVKKIMPEVEISVNQNALPDNRSYKVDFSLFESLAKEYYPIHTIEDTIQELIDGLRSVGFNDTGFRSSHLIRLNTLKALIKSNLLNNELEVVKHPATVQQN